MAFLDLKNVHFKSISKNTINENWLFLQNQGRIDFNKPRVINYENWMHDIWKNESCYVVAAGPSLKGFDFNLLNNKHTIGINHVIEDYNDFEWFIFLDQRFLDLTSYDLREYKGHIFAQNNTELNPAKNITLFKCKNDSVGDKFSDGLFKSALTGLVALNLAILSGANPIYLLGLDCGGSFTDTYHYKNDYPGEEKTKIKYRKYQRTAYFFDNFAAWKDRIINLSEISQIKTFKKKSLQEHFAKKNQLKIESRKPVVMHLSFSGDVLQLGDISRLIIRNCYGKHRLESIDNPIPDADLYILEHFISTNRQINNFAYKEKAIDLVHTMNCYPIGNFKKIISLTNTWKKILAQKGIDSNVIYGGIDIFEYKDRAKFENKTIGRITRWSETKIHPGWNQIIKGILDENQDVKCLIYTQFLRTAKRPILKHERMIYDESVHIFEYKGQYLKNMSIYVHANHTFKEICSHALMEAMAAGLPIILLYEESSAEVLGDAGIICNTIDEVKKNILLLLQDKDLWSEYSLKSLKRAQFFSYKKMIKKWDKVIKECLK